MPGTHERLEEIQTIVSGHVGAGTRTKEQPVLALNHGAVSLNLDRLVVVLIHGKQKCLVSENKEKRHNNECL